MKLNYSIDKHHVCFPTKVLSTRQGHTLNIVIDEDTDNGTIVGVGDYVSFDQYQAAAAPAAYEAKILEKAADGWGWYVQVTKIDVNAPAVLIREVPITKMNNLTTDFADEANLYNEAGKTVAGYVLTTLDVYELSEDAFDGKPTEGATVAVLGQKHVVTKTDSTDTTPGETA